MKLPEKISGIHDWLAPVVLRVLGMELESLNADLPAEEQTLGYVNDRLRTTSALHVVNVLERYGVKTPMDVDELREHFRKGVELFGAETRTSPIVRIHDALEAGETMHFEYGGILVVSPGLHGEQHGQTKRTEAEGAPEAG